MLKNKKSFDQLLSRSPYLWVGCGIIFAWLGISIFHPMEAYAGATNSKIPSTNKVEPAPKLEPAPALDSSMPMSNYNRSWYSDIKQSVVHIESGDKKKQQGGGGSGVVIDSSGWVLTCNHVVRSFKEAKVVMWDGREHRGKVTHSNDPRLDIALIKINASGLKPLKFGDSDALYVGDRVIAAGSPLGLDHSYSFGHISALNRENFVAANDRRGEIYRYGDVVQTDIALNPGNSGGPLINEKREIIGMNTIIPGGTGYNVGIGFALKSKLLKVATEILKKNGEFNGSIIGAGLENLKKYLADQHGIPGGALIQGVSRGTPAFKAGIKKDDIITKIDNITVKYQSDVTLHLLSIPPNTKVKISLIRGNQKKDVELVTTDTSRFKSEQRKSRPKWNSQFPRSPFDGFLERFFGPSFEIPDDDGPDDEETEDLPSEDLGAEVEEEQSTKAKPKLGATVIDLTKEVRSEYHIPPTVKGVVIKSVISGGIAAKAKLKKGDVIFEFCGKEIDNVVQLKEILGKAKVGQHIPLRYGRYSKKSSSEVTLNIKL